MLQWASNLFRYDLAIDLGTANLLVYVVRDGIVVDEPSYVAVKENCQNGNGIVAVGSQAKAMLGREPKGVRTIRPIRNGVIGDFRAAQVLIRHFIDQARCRTTLVKPRVAVCVPSGVSPVERRAVMEAVEQAGANTVHLFSEPMVAAVGASLPVDEPEGSMIVDIGGGTTEVAVIALKGIVCSESLPVAGDKLDDAIISYMRREHKLLIGEQTAEQIKVSVGAAARTEKNQSMKVRGRDLIEQLPRTVEVSEEELLEVLLAPINEITEAIKRVLEKTPAELSSDICEYGVTLAGGGALLKNLDSVVSERTGLPVMIAEDPLTACVVGCGKILRDLNKFEHTAL